MTFDDAFDARLNAAFAQAAEPLETEAEADRFAQKVIERLGRPARKRALMLGGAGSIGSAIAGTQLEGAFASMSDQAEGAMGSFAFFVNPEVLATAAIAIAVGSVALLLPRRLASL